jgi:glycine cleavage system H protein
MVVLMVILTVVVVFILEGLLFPRPRADRATEPGREPRPATPVRVAPGLRCFHPGHSWAEMSGLSEAVIGVTDLGPRLLGRIQSIELPEPGAFIHQGDPLLTLRRGPRVLRPAAPLSGVVVRVNPALEREPGLLLDSPLDRGWIALIEPSDPQGELRNLFRGAAAGRWHDVVHLELARVFDPEAAPALADGGVPAPDLGARLDDEAWGRAVETFFPPLLPRDEAAPTHTERE